MSPDVTTAEPRTAADDATWAAESKKTLIVRTVPAWATTSRVTVEVEVDPVPERT